jgi:response regulator RpfG family c-di-GMP phosphodiesterase
MALADVFDALISRRVYKEPNVVDAFIAIFDEFTAIAERYRDDAATEVK